MDSLEKQRIESQINQLILPYADNYSGPQGYRITNTLTGITEFRPEFMNHLPDGVRVSIEDLVKRLNAF